MLSEATDSVIWPHTSFGCFSVKSLYSRLICGSVSSKFKDIWSAHIPRKIKNFLWQAIRERPPAADQIRKRNEPVSEFCVVCAGREDSDHILFKCDLAAWLWSCTRSWLGVNWAPNSFADCLSLLRSCPVKWNVCSGLASLQCTGFYGSLETSSLLNMSFLTNPLTVFLNCSSFYSNRSRWIKLATRMPRSFCFLVFGQRRSLSSSVIKIIWRSLAFCSPLLVSSS